MSTPQPQPFQAEVSRLLDIVVHALYSQKEIFLRELISNAADACDKLRYLALSKPELAPAKYAIHVSPEGPTGKLIISDNGIGMNREDLTELLGTIARSGTKTFLEQIEANKKGDMNLIGQFGVGFYSAFMVADKVEVLTRKAGEEQAWRWSSDGKGTYIIEEAKKHLAGTEITLTLKTEEQGFLDDSRIKHIIKTYSDHIAVPIYLGDDEGTQLNRAAALWTRSKSEISEADYKEFYHHVAHAYDEPDMTIHWKAEGKLEYTGLLFVPLHKPHDMFDPKRQNRVKLYVKRVFITENAEGLLPPYLRFLRGVIDSEDLPLNISREMLQHNPVLAKLKHGITKRVLQEFLKRAEDAKAYAHFWENYGVILKEGLYDDLDFREDLLKLFRTRTTKGEALVSLDDYVARMPPEQDCVYYINGDDPNMLAHSPQLEGFRARDIEVMLFSDAIDDFWVGAVGEYKGKKLVSVTRGDADLDKIKKVDAPADAPKPEQTGVAELVAALKTIYGEAVKDVKESTRLTDSPVCLVAGDADVDFHLEKLLRQNKVKGLNPRRILEINPRHSLILKMATQAKAGQAEALSDSAWLLLDQARLLEGDIPSDTAAFTQRLTRLIEKAVA